MRPNNDSAISDLSLQHNKPVLDTTVLPMPPSSSHELTTTAHLSKLRDGERKFRQKASVGSPREQAANGDAEHERCEWNDVENISILEYSLL
jgi:hypothetical protein